jgi:hypothetical protein
MNNTGRICEAIFRRRKYQEAINSLEEKRFRKAGEKKRRPT